MVACAQACWAAAVALGTRNRRRVLKVAAQVMCVCHIYVGVQGQFVCIMGC